MPNHVSTKIVFKADSVEDKEKLNAALSLVRTSFECDDESGVNFFDLNKIIEQPKELEIIEHYALEESLIYFLTNRLENKFSSFVYKVWGWGGNPKGNLERTKELVLKYDEYGRLKPEFENQFIVLPKTLDNLYQSGKAITALRVKHGVNNSLDWARKYWNTKWNTYETNYCEEDHSLFFQTAWSLPYTPLDKFMKDNALSCTLYSFDEGFNFWHKIEYKDGVIIDRSDSEDRNMREIYYEVYGYEYEYDEDEDEENNAILMC